MTAAQLARSVVGTHAYPKEVSGHALSPRAVTRSPALALWYVPQLALNVLCLLCECTIFYLLVFVVFWIVIVHGNHV